MNEKRKNGDHRKSTVGKRATSPDTQRGGKKNTKWGEKKSVQNSPQGARLGFNPTFSKKREKLKKGKHLRKG